MVVRHNHLHDVIVDFCRRPHLSVTVEKGHGLTRNHNHTRPADVSLRGGTEESLQRLTSPLCPAILGDSCRMSGAASTVAETCKLLSNHHKCQELGWTCIPLAVESFCNWGKEAHLTFSRLASHLAISMSSPKPSILADIFDRLNITLARSIARAILAKKHQT